MSHARRVASFVPIPQMFFHLEQVFIKLILFDHNRLWFLQLLDLLMDFFCVLAGVFQSIPRNDCLENFSAFSFICSDFRFDCHIYELLTDKVDSFNSWHIECCLALWVQSIEQNQTKFQDTFFSLNPGQAYKRRLFRQVEGILMDSWHFWIALVEEWQCSIVTLVDNEIAYTILFIGKDTNTIEDVLTNGEWPSDLIALYLSTEHA